MKWSDLYLELKITLGTDSQWEESELKLYTNWAIRIYSEYFPQQKSTELSTDGDTQEWTLPNDFLKVNRVECPDETFLEEIQIAPGTEFYSSGYPNMWYVEGGKLHITYAPDTDDTLTLHYFAKHTEIVSSSTELTVPDRHVGLLHLYVASRATVRLMIDVGRRDRFKMRQIDAGTPEQNPITPVHRILEQEFWVALFDAVNKEATGTVELHRRGRGA